MENLYFKCRCCKSHIRMDKKVIDDFSGWAYYEGIEWSDFDEDVPDLTEEHWERSEILPIENTNRTLFVRKPFDESIGSEFWIYFEPALIHFNGWDDIYEKDIDKCAIVRCKLTNILKRNEYGAWVVVNVREVISVSELHKYFEPCETEKGIDFFDGIPEKIQHSMFENDKWLVRYWDAQGDCGEIKWIYTDNNGTRHLVMQSYFDFDQSIMYIGNIIRRIANEQN